MKREEVARARWVAQEIARDCERDVKAMEGKPFTGRNVAEAFGETLAMVMALAHLVDALLVEAHPFVVEAEEHPAATYGPYPPVTIKGR